MDRVPQMESQDILDHHDRAIGARTRVLVIPHIDNMVGLRHPLPAIAELAHARGVKYVVVDGAQSAGMIPLDLAASGADAYAMSTHKWIQSPKGLGLLYLTEELQSELKPMSVTWGQTRWQGTPRIFEDYGTRNLAALLALGDALEFQAAIGVQVVTTRHQEVFDHVRARVESSAVLEWRSPRDWELGASLMSIGFNGPRSSDLASTLLDEERIVLRAFSVQGLEFVRISPNVMNDDQEIDLFMTALEELVTR
jgi:selenocysteine lyase/cysteine desulfurase